MASARRSYNLFDLLETALPRLVVAPSVVAMMVFVYGFVLWTIYISMSKSTFLPNYDFVGLLQYVKLWKIDRWYVACRNLLIYGGLFILFCTVFGLLLAIFLDQKIRCESVLRTVYLYPLSLSFVVTGTAWRWMLNPGLGLERLVREMGWQTFSFDWLVNSEMAIYTVVIAAVWQSTGFVMAMFLAGLRGIDSSIIKAAQVDGASLPRIYWKIIIPSLRPVFFGTFIILTHIAIKSFDLVVVLTRGGPGYSTDLPATFMYAYAFTRGRLALGASSATMMFMMVMAIIVPYLYSELRSRSHG
jgi:glucose/mannose transport system permease protein